MYSFKNDYSEDAHPNILRALQYSNMIQEEGYGLNSPTKNAIALIKEKLAIMIATFILFLDVLLLTLLQSEESYTLLRWRSCGFSINSKRQ